LAPFCDVTISYFILTIFCPFLYHLIPNVPMSGKNGFILGCLPSESPRIDEATAICRERIIDRRYISQRIKWAKQPLSRFVGG